ncbi:Hypothetical protein HVR_LOCUS849 [uncultured virus]|nr:Hypothetical protein HVR_LOCUS849 [uncultured virus]
MSTEKLTGGTAMIYDMNKGTFNEVRRDGKPIIISKIYHGEDSAHVVTDINGISYFYGTLSFTPMFPNNTKYDIADCSISYYFGSLVTTDGALWYFKLNFPSFPGDLIYLMSGVKSVQIGLWHMYYLTMDNMLFKMDIPDPDKPMKSILICEDVESFSLRSEYPVILKNRSLKYYYHDNLESLLPELDGRVIKLVRGATYVLDDGSYVYYDPLYGGTPLYFNNPHMFFGEHAPNKGVSIEIIGVLLSNSGKLNIICGSRQREDKISKLEGIISAQIIGSKLCMIVDRDHAEKNRKILKAE